MEVRETNVEDKALVKKMHLCDQANTRCWLVNIGKTYPM